MCGSFDKIYPKSIPSWHLKGVFCDHCNIGGGSGAYYDSRCFVTGWAGSHQNQSQLQGDSPAAPRSIMVWPPNLAGIPCPQGPRYNCFFKMMSRIVFSLPRQYTVIVPKLESTENTNTNPHVLLFQVYAYIDSFNPHDNPLREAHYDSHFAGKETEAHLQP